MSNWKIKYQYDYQYDINIFITFNLKSQEHDKSVSQ